MRGVDPCTDGACKMGVRSAKRRGVDPRTDGAWVLIVFFSSKGVPVRAFAAVEDLVEER